MMSLTLTKNGEYSKIKSKDCWRNPVATRKAYSGKTWFAVKRSTLIGYQAAMRQQHTSYRLEIKTAADFSLEGFRQDEVFKAHAFTRRRWHPVAKRCP